MVNSKYSLAAAAMLMLCAAAQAEPATVGSKLKLRAGPGQAFQVLVLMPAGATVDVVACNGPWCRVKYGGQTGYANRDLLGTGADSYAAAPPPAHPPAAIAPPALIGPQVWRWNDPESRDRNWRRLQWHNRLNRP